MYLFLFERKHLRFFRIYETKDDLLKSWSKSYIKQMKPFIKIFYLKVEKTTQLRKIEEMRWQKCSMW